MQDNKLRQGKLDSNLTVGCLCSIHLTEKASDPEQPWGGRAVAGWSVSTSRVEQQGGAAAGGGSRFSGGGSAGCRRREQQQQGPGRRRLASKPRRMGRRGQTSHFPWLAGLKKIKNLGNANGSRRNGIFMNGVIFTPSVSF